jgi:hypothetical protein
MKLQQMDITTVRTKHYKGVPRASERDVINKGVPRASERKEKLEKESNFDFESAFQNAIQDYPPPPEDIYNPVGLEENSHVRKDVHSPEQACQLIIDRPAEKLLARFFSFCKKNPDLIGYFRCDVPEIQFPTRRGFQWFVAHIQSQFYGNGYNRCVNPNMLIAEAWMFYLGTGYIPPVGHIIRLLSKKRPQKWHSPGLTKFYCGIRKVFLGTSYEFLNRMPGIGYASPSQTQAQGGRMSRVGASIGDSMAKSYIRMKQACRNLVPSEETMDRFTSMSKKASAFALASGVAFGAFSMAPALPPVALAFVGAALGAATWDVIKNHAYYRSLPSKLIEKFAGKTGKIAAKEALKLALAGVKSVAVRVRDEAFNLFASLKKIFLEFNLPESMVSVFVILFILYLAHYYVPTRPQFSAALIWAFLALILVIGTTELVYDTAQKIAAYFNKRLFPTAVKAVSPVIKSYVSIANRDVWMSRRDVVFDFSEMPASLLEPLMKVELTFGKSITNGKWARYLVRLDRSLFRQVWPYMVPQFRAGYKLTTRYLTGLSVISAPFQHHAAILNNLKDVKEEELKDPDVLLLESPPPEEITKVKIQQDILAENQEVLYGDEEVIEQVEADIEAPEEEEKVLFSAKKRLHKSAPTWLPKEKVPPGAKVITPPTTFDDWINGTDPNELIFRPPEETEAQAGSVLGIISVLGYVLSFGSKPAYVKELTYGLNLFRAGTHASEFLNSVYTGFPVMIERLLCWWKQIPTKTEEVFLHYKEILGKAESYMCMSTSVFEAFISSDADNPKKIIALYAQLSTLRDFAMRDPLFNAQLRTLLSTTVLRFMELYKKAMEARSLHSNRMVPVSIWLEGAPGTGKSHMIQLLLSALRHQLVKRKRVEGYYTSGMRFERKAGGEYWDGYCGQWATTFDDIFQALDPQMRTITSLEFIYSINSNIYPLNMAHLDNKGAVLFESKVVISTTNACSENVFHANRLANLGITDIDAVKRRRDFIVSVSMGQVKYPVTNVNCYRNWILELIDPSTLKKTPISFQDLVTRAADVYCSNEDVAFKTTSINSCDWDQVFVAQMDGAEPKKPKEYTEEEISNFKKKKTQVFLDGFNKAIEIERSLGIARSKDLAFVSRNLRQSSCYVNEVDVRNDLSKKCGGINFGEALFKHPTKTKDQLSNIFMPYIKINGNDDEHRAIMLKYRAPIEIQKFFEFDASDIPKIIRRWSPQLYQEGQKFFNKPPEINDLLKYTYLQRLMSPTFLTEMIEGGVRSSALEYCDWIVYASQALILEFAMMHFFDPVTQCIHCDHKEILDVIKQARNAIATSLQKPKLFNAYPNWVNLIHYYVQLPSGKYKSCITEAVDSKSYLVAQMRDKFDIFNDATWAFAWVNDIPYVVVEKAKQVGIIETAKQAISDIASFARSHPWISAMRLLTLVGLVTGIAYIIKQWFNVVGSYFGASGRDTYAQSNPGMAQKIRNAKKRFYEGVSTGTRWIGKTLNTNTVSQMESQSGSNSLSPIIRKFLNQNVPMGVVYQDGYVATTRVQFVKGRVAITASHPFLYGKQIMGLSLFVPDGSEGSVFVFEKDIRTKIFEGRDLILIEFPKSVGPYADLTNHVNDSEIDSAPEPVRATLEGEHVVCHVGTHIYEGQPVKSLASYEDLIRKIPLEDYYLARGIEGYVGDCGFPYFLRQDSVQKKWIGIHVASNPNQGCFSRVTKKEILDFESPQNVCQSPPLQRIQSMPNLAPLLELDEEVVPQMKGIHVQGVLKDRVDFIPGKTNLFKLPFGERQIHPPSKKPAPLRPFTNADGVKVSPLDNLFKKYASKRNMGRLELPRTEYRSLWPKGVLGRRFRMLTKKEAVFGCPELKVSPIPRKTSMGYPGIWLNLTKDDWIDWENQTLHPDLEALIDEDLANLELGAITLVYLDCLKDELRPIEKADLGKTRVFARTSLHQYIIARMLFAPLLVAMQEGQGMTPITIGIDHSTEAWKNLYKTLSKYKDMCDGDFENYDIFQVPQFAYECFEAIKEFCYDEHHQKLVLHYLISRFKSLHVCRNLVYYVLGSGPSGDLLTIFCNDIINFHMHSVCFKLIYDLLEFDEHVVSKFEGDDSGCAVAPLCPDYNMITLQKLMKLIFSYTYTSADKSAVVEPYHTLETMQYCKRRFVKSGSVVFSPLEEESIHNMVMWSEDKTKHRHVVQEEMVHVAMSEWFHHGKAKFDAMKELYNQGLRSIDRPVYTKTWEELYNKFLSHYAL